MKHFKILLALTLLNVAFISYAQETKFELTANGYEPKVFEITNQNKDEIYKLTKALLLLLM